MAAAPPHLDEGHLRLTRAGFNPTVEDVIEVRRILTGLSMGDHTVPMEIALMILSLASYRPCQSSIKQLAVRYEANDFWSEGPWATIAGPYLTVATLSVPTTVARARSIIFQMRSADQGWADAGGHGTYHNSHTWYEASILRPRPDAAALTDADMENFRNPEEARDHFRHRGWDMVEGNGTVAWRVHNNITARTQYRNYRVDWIAGIPTEVGDPRAMGDGQGFLELLRPDDVVVLWARAEQQAWVNKIREATIEIEYEVL
ncbi:hypothetical protein F4802DRAFT_87600 [Xylaria palmicola]|nr:hypothetical protein F4802DRAFT_87600 [Xylaria palmicola]